MSWTYEEGLQKIGNDVWAYLLPDGSWGRSNAGLVAGSTQSLLIDTLFDKPLTQQMLDAMSGITAARPIRMLVNTHANGDHCYGNELVPADAEIYSSKAALHEIEHVTPQVLHDLMTNPKGDDVDWFKEIAFGAFKFDDIDMRYPDHTFTGRVSLELDDRKVDLIEVGPAHTAGDVIIHLPQDGIVFAGDIVFVDDTPIMWEGPIEGMLAACDTIMALDADIVVPGHGPITDNSGVDAMKRYFQHVEAEARTRFDAGMAASAAAHSINLGEFAAWKDAERVVVTVDALYRHWDPEAAPPDIEILFTEMARYRRTLSTV